MAVLALLIGILLPALLRARGEAASVICMSNWRQIHYAETFYRSDNEDWLCMAWNWTPDENNWRWYDVRKGILGGYLDTLLIDPASSKWQDHYGTNYGRNSHVVGWRTALGRDRDGWARYKMADLSSMKREDVILGADSFGYITWAGLEARHADRTNLLLLDGHAESAKPDRLKTILKTTNIMSAE